jgi:hypothetical protein
VHFATTKQDEAIVNSIEKFDEYRLHECQISLDELFPPGLARRCAPLLSSALLRSIKRTSIQVARNRRLKADRSRRCQRPCKFKRDQAICSASLLRRLCLGLCCTRQIRSPCYSNHLLFAHISAHSARARRVQILQSICPAPFHVRLPYCTRKDVSHHIWC